MTPVGVVMMFMALIHDFWMPPSPSSPTLWPYGAAACGFYFALDMAAAGVAEAWEKASSKG
jgi:hypothetical protein